MKTTILHALAIAGVAAFAASAALAEDCAICAKSVVTNSDLATCFLEKYGEAAPAGGGAIAVDLTRCERSRSIVQALPSPAKAVEEPDTRFLLSRSQLDCLVSKLEDPDLVLDPQARIELDGCR